MGVGVMISFSLKYLKKKEVLAILIAAFIFAIPISISISEIVIDNQNNKEK